jgi:uncharacterized protein GlcG (DUF336 family)
VTQLTLATANRIIEVALAKGREMKLAPLTVVVLDAGGHAVALQREDGSGILRADIASGKAWGALGMGFGSREFLERAAKAPAFINAITSVSHGRLVPVPGGVLVRNDANETIGAVGISGDMSDHDETCALAGIAAVGLRAAVGVPG